MTIRDIAVSFGVEVDKGSVSKAEGAMSGLKSMAKRLLGAIGIGFSIAGISSLAQASADAEALKSQFEQVFGDVEKDATNKLNKIADDTGVAVNRMKGSFTQIAAFAKTTGMDEANALEIADRSLVAVADSAAFYDKSIEQVTNSLQSFLKGNYQQDAALGLSCTETTRNAKANEMYGKTFAQLTEAQKQLTLLGMVEDANKASGAIGQAARESDTWTNQLGNLKQQLQDLKAATGNAILKPAVMVVKSLYKMLQLITKGVSKLTSETGSVAKAFNEWFTLIKKLQPLLERCLTAAKNGLDKVIDFAERVANKFGGVKNVVKLLIVVVGAFVAAFAWGKVIAGAKIFLGLLSKMKGILSFISLKMLAIVAVIVALALIVEDFVNFLAGNDSLIGTIFDKLGIGADNARQTIIGLFGKVKDVIISVFGVVKEIVKKLLTPVVATIKAFVNLVKVIFRGLKAFWKNWGENIKSCAQGLWENIVSVVSGALNVITGVMNLFSSILQGDWSGAWEAVKQIASGAWEMITGAFGVLFETLKGILDTGLELLKSGINAAIEWIKELPGKAIQWGADIINGLVQGIKDSISNVSEAASEIAGKIKSFLHFSVPDEGPLVDYETWMPDFMAGLAEGISGNEHLVTDKIQSLAGNIKALIQSATASAATAAGSRVSNSTSNMTQNVTINNSYSGGSTETQKNVSKAMKKSAVDATTRMARGLAYARG